MAALHRRFASHPLSIAVALLVCVIEAVAQTPPSEHLRVPDGFTVQRCAAPPLVEYPMMACFDPRGRLFVTESPGTNLDFKQLSLDPPGKVLMLEDTDGDGTFDRRTVFADKLTFPSGALWHDGALYVTSPPGLWRLRDTDDDGVADERDEIVTGFGSVGNAADLHGPFLGPDRWLYFCDGRNGHDVTLGDGTRWTGKAACMYRCRPDGSGLEVVFGGGFDNPVEVAFTPTGEPLVNVNILHAHPFRVDALVYGLDGANYPHDGAWKELKRTGDFLPSAGDLGWVATSGFMRYRGTAADDPHRGRYFSTQFNTHIVQTHTVERDGGGFRVGHADFLTSTNPDFRPTDVLEDADGSLLVIDTGGWFRIGCPNSQVAKPQVTGAIYRIRRTGVTVTDPRGRGIGWDGLTTNGLAALLADARPAVRDRAASLLLARPSDEAAIALRAAMREPHENAALEALWAAAAMDAVAGRQAVRDALADERVELRVAAAHAAASSGDREAIPQLVSRLNDNAAPVRRAAATALGRLRAGEAVAALLARAAGATDRFEEHAHLYALIRIGNREPTVTGLSDTSPAVRRAALIALDQMHAAALTADLTVPHLASDHASLRDTALSIAAAHPDWAAQAVGPLRAALTKPALPASEADAVRSALVAFARSPAIQGLVAETLGAGRTSDATRLLVLRAATESNVTPLPEGWVAPLGALLRHVDEPIVTQTVEVIRTTRAAQFDPSLSRIARDAARPVALRIAALSLTLPRGTSLADEDFRLLLDGLESARPLERLDAARALAAAPLNAAQLVRLTGALPEAGPLELPVLLAAFERSTADDVARAMIDALTRAKAAPGLSPGALTAALAKCSPEVRGAAAPLLEKLGAGVAAQQARVAELEPLVTGGDASRGQAVFFGKQSACATCHAVRGVGGQVGPDLSKIGAVRSARDLLESVVAPSASFARGYEPIIVETTANDLYSGTLAGETPDAIVLRTPVEVRVARSAVRSIRRDRVSVMPQGLDAQLSRRELADLLAFLQSLK